MDDLVKTLNEHSGSRPDKHYKTTLFQSEALLLGLNCLEPGQTQPAHDHDDQDKFYYVVSGAGRFVLGDREQTAGAGQVVWAPAGLLHGVTNTGDERLTLLVGIAPSP
ncbi:MAG TPA: cupin domain-containing protein [Candidatus Sulfomarinibacteraceae bacterium]|nr:cupin domain-containing protein [Candidatus Sulfomarinibacteraceae bacterium]